MFTKCKQLKEKRLPIKSTAFSDEKICKLFADIDLVDLGLLAGGTGEEVLCGDYGGALIALDLLNPELHC
mgnify:CR=1 FL=1